MDDLDRAVESLKFQIKREIVDNYFADRVYLQEEMELLQQEAQAYRQEAEQVSRRFFLFYQALGSQATIALLMEMLGLKEWPCYEEFCRVPMHERPALLKGCRFRGFTAWRRCLNLVFDLYEELQRAVQELHDNYAKIQVHQQLLNEDIDKFHLSYDFGLIAAQIEALEGRQAVISGGLLAPEREELSTRMRLKRQKLTAAELPELPVLPPLKEIKSRLQEIMAKTR